MIITAQFSTRRTCLGLKKTIKMSTPENILNSYEFNDPPHNRNLFGALAFNSTITTNVFGYINNLSLTQGVIHCPVRKIKKM